MRSFRLRAWAQQTLYDYEDYVVEADSIEDAAGRLDAALEAAEHGRDMDSPSGISRILFTGSDGVDALAPAIRLPDPDEIVDGESGIAEIDVQGCKLREVLPAGSGTPGPQPV